MTMTNSTDINKDQNALENQEEAHGNAHIPVYVGQKRRSDGGHSAAPVHPPTRGQPSPQAAGAVLSWGSQMTPFTLDSVGRSRNKRQKPDAPCMEPNSGSGNLSGNGDAQQRNKSSATNGGGSKINSRGSRARVSNEELQRIAAGNGPEARKAARQLRNRESAAESRRKKEREIEDLQSEIQTLKKRLQERDQQLALHNNIIHSLLAERNQSCTPAVAYAWNSLPTEGIPTTMAVQDPGCTGSYKTNGATVTMQPAESAVQSAVQPTCLNGCHYNAPGKHMEKTEGMAANKVVLSSQEQSLASCLVQTSRPQLSQDHS
eukprot:gb/GECG01010380.1/.p1 GENE.gb/GECG01010380.1/~~gb/GECG01010380.1/.p1  ORF type:complete len:318 (+),score=41.49 gb/GECG01010380.1/:1-954(+)